MTILKRASLFTLLMMLVATSVSAQSFKALLRKANKEYDLKVFNLAVNSYQQALAKDRNSSEALGKLADCYRHLNQMNEAARYYAQMLSQRRYDRKHILEYAHVLKALGRYDEAKQWYQEYQKDDPTMGTHYAQTCDFAKMQLNANTGFFALNEEINSSSSDFGPAYFGKTQMVYASSSLDLQRANVNWTGVNENQLYVCQLSPDGALRDQQFLQSGIGEFYNQGPVAFSPDGLFVAYTKNNFTDGTRQVPSAGLELSIYIAEISSTGEWVNETPFTHNGTNVSSGYPSFSPDGSAMFFASDRPGGYGGFDLYVSYKMGTSWSSPVNLGAVVNTPGNEISPFFDGQQLFLASDYHAGLGGFDVFRAEQEGARWSKVFHLGVPINSGYDDYGFIYDSFQERGYLTSNRPGGKGNEDIYRITKNTTTSSLAIIRIKNANDGSSVPNAILDFSSCGLSTYFADELGIYKFSMDNSNIDCEVMISKDGFSQQVVRISRNLLAAQPELEVYLNPNSIIGDLPGSQTNYQGKVVDYQTRQPLQNVFITALDQATGQSLQAATDPQGNYTLALQRDKTYFITYASAFYQQISKPISTFGMYNPNLLGEVTLIAGNNPGDGGTGGGGINPPITDPTSGPTVSGFAVQVAALKQDKVDQYASLTSIGNVYSKLENGAYKIRVGVFPTRNEASTALASVKRKGYKTAFIVKDEAEGRGSGTTQPNNPVNPNPINPGVSNPTNPVNPGTNPGPTNPAGDFYANGYKIQMGAFRNPNSFDSSKVSQYGVVQDRLNTRGLTLKLLAGFNSLSDAQLALPRVKNAGFKSAFIVLEQNGVISRVR